MAELDDNVSGSSGQTSRSEGPASRSLTTTGRRTRNFPPLVVALVLVTFIVVTVLPSALNLPQSQPSTVLEYAPIPPEDDTPPPSSEGGLSSLGLASSSSLFSRPPTAPPSVTKKLPPISAQKRCVSGRQTEDPNAPPCQSFFEGDNGGATYQGVTKDEVTVLIYTSTGIILNQGQGETEQTPGGGTYCDVDLLDCDADGEADEDPHDWVEIANAFSRYFNNRYQTYQRHIHFYYYWSSAGSESGRKGDAQDNWETLEPFAVLPQPWNGGFVDAYIDAMALREISVFGAFDGRPRSYYDKETNQRKVWSYWPDVENWADGFVDFMCAKAPAGSKVSHGPFSGQTRTYGFYWTTDAGYPSLRYMKDLVKAGLKNQCGITGTDFTYSVNDYWFQGSNTDMRTEAQDNAVAMQQHDPPINTVIWPGGVETHLTEGLARINHLPEIIVAGDGDNDGLQFARLQDQTAWANAWAYSYQLREDNREQDPGYQAYKEADPQGNDWNWATTFYRDWFMLFTAIQVAGPKLTPDAVDAGLHAIQSKKSVSPYTAAFFFYPGDYTAVKDAYESYWDPNSKDPEGGDGCYRMQRQGNRQLIGTWSEAKGAGLDVPGYTSSSDPCNGYGGRGATFSA